ncbi:glycosyltransferase family 2 protein [Mycena leptocephala]|nr:glycosyltransferase family 2 protein [Mycena leptocephala]
MDQSSLLYGALTLVVCGLVSSYVALVILSPPSILADLSSVDLTVVVPAYNEAKRLPVMLASTIDHLTSPALKGKRTYEIIIVDDGSSDGTSAVSLKLAAKYPKCDIRVVTLEKNLGKGGAVRHGMLFGGGERLLMVDADDASRFVDLELLWEAMDKIAPDNGAGVVVGSRAHLVKTEAVVKRSLLRNILMYGLHTILRIVGVGHIRDTQCGFKLFSRAAAQQIFPAQHLPTWIFDVELLLLAKQLSISVAEVPIQWHEVAGSKLNVVSASLQMLRDLLIVRANHLLGRWKVVPPKAKSE